MKRGIYGLACNKFDTQIAIVENIGEFSSIQESCVRLYDVGRQRDDEDEAEEDDDEDLDASDDDGSNSASDDNNVDGNNITLFAAVSILMCVCVSSILNTIHQYLSV